MKYRSWPPLAKKNKITPESIEFKYKKELAMDTRVIATLKAEIFVLNKKLKAAEKIKQEKIKEFTKYETTKTSTRV